MKNKVEHLNPSSESEEDDAEVDLSDYYKKEETLKLIMQKIKEESNHIQKENEKKFENHLSQIQ